MAEGTGSAVLSLCMNPIAGILLRLPKLQDAMYRNPRDNLLSFNLLLQWLSRPDAALLGALAETLRAHDQATLHQLRAASAAGRNA